MLWQFDGVSDRQKKGVEHFDRGIFLNDKVFPKGKFVADRHSFFMIDAISIRNGNDLTKIKVVTIRLSKSLLLKGHIIDFSSSHDEYR